MKKKPPLASRIFFSKPVLWLTGYLLRFLTTLLFATLKVRFIGKELLQEKTQGRLIISLWHDELFLAPLIRKVLKKHPLAIVVSKSRDGKILSAYINTYSNAEAIEVASNKRHAALLQMVQAVEEGKTLLITPDGPRGPKHVIKPGLPYTAEKAQAHILTMHWHASSVWHLNTWDQMQIPKPFAKVEIRFAPPPKEP